jgi:hypothetical protein
VKHGTVGGLTAGKTVAAHNTLETTSLTGSLYIDDIADIEQFTEAHFLANFVLGWILYPELTNMIEPFRVRLFQMTGFRLVDSASLLASETNLDGLVTVDSFSLDLQNLARPRFDNCNRSSLTQFAVYTGHPDFLT